MNISVKDFNFMLTEQSRRDVRIATLEMELKIQAAKFEQRDADQQREINALWAENIMLREQNDMLRSNFENIRYENYWIKKYILLSVEKVRHFFSHIHDIRLLSVIKSFVMDMLPSNATPEQIAYAREVLELPIPDEMPTTVNVSGDYVVKKNVEEHTVERVEAGATGITIVGREDEA